MDIQAFPSPVASEPDAIERTVNQLHGELLGVFQVMATNTNRSGKVITFRGKLLFDPETAYQELEQRLEPYGFTPMLRREQGKDVLIAYEGLSTQRRTGNPLVNLALLVITIFTTLIAGAGIQGNSIVEAVRYGGFLQVMATLASGASFAVPLLAILGVHELGHYVAARLHGISATLPYFIPMPVGGLGTLGAFIALRSPMKNRKILFDVGMSGPIAGALVALPLLLVGLWMSPAVPQYAAGNTLHEAGSSLLVDVMVRLFHPVPTGYTLRMHNIFFAAWIGLFITSINLLPIGQLDGGHVAYAMFGRRANLLALIVFFLLILAGAIFASLNWFFLAFFVLVVGLSHPPPLNDATKLDPLRRLIGWGMVLLFLVTIVPAPFAGLGSLLFR